MTSNWYEDLPIVIILCLTPEIILRESFYIQNIEVKTCWDKNKQWKNHQIYTNIYFAFGALGNVEYLLNCHYSQVPSDLK